VLNSQLPRAWVSGNLRIVAMSYLAGGCLAAVGLVAVVALTPAGEAVREALTAPFVQLAERGRPPARVVDVAPIEVATLLVRVEPAGEDALSTAASPVNVIVPLAALPGGEGRAGVAGRPPEIRPSVESRVVPVLEARAQTDAWSTAVDMATVTAQVPGERVSETSEQSFVARPSSPLSARSSPKPVVTTVADSSAAEPPVAAAEVLPIPTTPSLPEPTLASVPPTAEVPAPTGSVPPVGGELVSTVVAMATSVPATAMPQPVATQVTGAALTATPVIPTRVPVLATAIPLVSTSVPSVPTRVPAVPTAPRAPTALPVQAPVLLHPTVAVPPVLH
jgi:hypothetical protein